MLLFCDVSTVEHNQMIWDFSVLKSICVSFINIIIFVNYLLIFCILNFYFVLSSFFFLFFDTTFYRFQLIIGCFCFCLCFFLLFFYLLFLFFYWVFSLSDIFRCVLEHVPLLSTTVLPLSDMLVTNLSLAQALEQQ